MNILPALIYILVNGNIPSFSDQSSYVSLTSLLSHLS